MMMIHLNIMIIFIIIIALWRYVSILSASTAGQTVAGRPAMQALVSRQSGLILLVPFSTAGCPHQPIGSHKSATRTGKGSRQVIIIKVS
jgi:ribosomal protein L16/L10AE